MRNMKHSYWRVCIALCILLSVVVTTTACGKTNHKAAEKGSTNAVQTEHSEPLPTECAHSEKTWIVNTEASLDSVGRKSLVCKECNEVLSIEEIPELCLTESQIIEKLRPSVVKVICYDYDGKTELSQGSGFFIDDDGTFITNAHVVEDCYYIKITSYSGATYDVDVMYEYKGTYSDYAICNAKNYFSSVPVDFAESANVGDIVYALGYPNDAYVMNTSSGVITNTDTIDGTKNFYSNTAWIDHGSSGGALVDSKGRVLGITTGVFSDGEYAALKYQDFKFDAERIHTGFREPWEFFHTVTEYNFSSFTMDRYFDIFVDVVSNTDTSVNYRVTVCLKEQYQRAKVLLDSYGSASIAVDIKTEYDYYEVKSYGTSHQNKSTRDTIYLYFYDEDDLRWGESGSSRSSIFISTMYDYYGMDVSYEAEFGILQSGKILIYT